MKRFTTKTVALVLCLSVCLMGGCGKKSKDKKDKDSGKDKDKKEITIEVDDETKPSESDSAPSVVETEPIGTEAPADVYVISWPNTNYYVPTSDPDKASLFIASIIQAGYESWAMAFFDDFIDMDMHYSEGYGVNGYEALGLADFNGDGLMDGYYTYLDMHIGVVLSQYDGSKLSVERIPYENGAASVIQMYDDGNGNYYVWDMYAAAMSQFGLDKIGPSSADVVCTYSSEWNDSTSELDVTLVMDGATTVYHDYADINDVICEHYGIKPTTIHTEDYRKFFIPCDSVDDALVSALIDKLGGCEGYTLDRREDVNGDGIEDLIYYVGQLGFTVCVMENGFEVWV